MIDRWLAGAERALEAGQVSGQDPVIYGHDKRARTKGRTASEYDGVTSATLKAWLRWWESPSRSPFGREEAGREPSVEIEKLRRELDARGS